MGKEETEIKLLETYYDEVQEVVSQLGRKIQSASDFDMQKRIYREEMRRWQHKLEIYEKQLWRVKEMLRGDSRLKYYDMLLYDSRAFLKMQESNYAKQAGGLFSSEYKELYEAIRLCDRALSFFENPGSRLRKVQCYIALSDKKKALQELDYMLEHYEDDENVYLQARKMKDELETPPRKGLFRSLFE